MLKKSPLAPKNIRKVNYINGIELYIYTVGFYKKRRPDLAIFLFKNKTTVAEVFTKSSLRSCTLDWNEKNLKNKEIQALVINSGNANTFTGQAGASALIKISKIVTNKFKVSAKKVFFASTGVIGEKFPEQKIINTIENNGSKTNNWLHAAKAIMTTDTFPKAISVKTKLDNKTITITGIAKGSGMIEPNMATMLGFIFIDCLIPQYILQKLLKELVDKSFNQITVDGEESTNDTVIITSTNSISLKNTILSIKDKRILKLKKSLISVFKYLAEQIVRDGEGATKLLNIKVESAKNLSQAKRIAKAIANSPLVKTAFYGNDPNWGRIVMAIGKTYEKINPNKLKIYIGEQIVVVNGAEYKKLNFQRLKKYMAGKEIDLKLDLGLGNYSYESQTCDFSHRYVDINASYRT